MITTELLRNSELLSIFDSSELEYIATKTEERSYKADEIVFNKGGAAIHFYMIKSGEVGITQINDCGERHELARYIPGDSCGEFDFITGSLHTVEARALKDTVVTFFPSVSNTLESLGFERPDIISKLYYRSLSILSSRLRSMHALIDENTTWVKALQEQIYLDPLTGLFTKAYMDSEIPRMLKPPATLLVIKPDKFKELNEIYGHQAGDIVIARIGSALKELTHNRPGWGIRIRSNEMAVVLLDFDKEKTIEIAKSLAKALKDFGPIWKSPNKGKETEPTFHYLTLSMALGIYQRGGKSWEHLFSTTYELMFKAWKEGGNKIFCH